MKGDVGTAGVIADDDAAVLTIGDDTVVVVVDENVIVIVVTEGLQQSPISRFTTTPTVSVTHKNC